MKQSVIILLSFLILSLFKAVAAEESVNFELSNPKTINKFALNFPLRKPEKPFLLIPIKKPEAPLLSRNLSNKEFKLLNLALEQSKKWKWERVSNIQKNIKDQDALNLIEWIRYYNGAADLTFSDYSNYIIKNNNWPEIEKIKFQAESKISYTESPSDIINYFDDNEVQTGLGKIYLGNAFISCLLYTSPSPRD